MIVEENGVWNVPLGKAHEPYRDVRMHRRFAGLPNYTVVIVDAQKFLRFFENDGGFVIPPARKWDKKRLAYHRDKLAPQGRGGSVEMPIAGIESRDVVHSRFFGLWKRKCKETIVSFTNGRHRARYMEYAGARAFPVEVDVREASMMTALCGWQGIAYQG